MELGALIKGLDGESSDSFPSSPSSLPPSLLLPCEDPELFSLENAAIRHNLGADSSPHQTPEPATTLTLDFPGSQTVREKKPKTLSFINYPVYSTLLQPHKVDEDT
jgi:hypothetical protein